MYKSIAFFDFDGTITTKDTMLEFIKFYKGKISFFKGMIFLLPWMIAMKLKLISKTTAKEKLLRYFFASEDITEFNKACKTFIKNKLPELIRMSALKKIEDHKKNGDEVVVVSAAISNWMEEWCIANNLKSISSRIEVVNQKVTGKLNGANCNDQEKVNRILKEYDLNSYKEIFCYGDTRGDKPMLRLATHAYYKRF